MARRTAWRPHLVLRQKPSGSYWYVVWRRRPDLTNYPPEVVPFMCRCSAQANTTHNFAARLNQRAGLAY